MDIIFSLLQIPSLLLLIGIILVFSVTSIFITHYFRRLVKLIPKRDHNEVVSYIFAIIGGFYGLLLGFVVFLVWDASNDAQVDVSREGSAAIALYRDLTYFPDAKKIAPIRTAYIDYVKTVIDYDFPAMEKMEHLDKNSRTALNKVFKMMGEEGINNAYASQVLRELNELSVYRSLRQVDASSSIPIEIWVPLLFGGFILLIFAALLEVKNPKLHLFVNGLLGSFIGLVFFIIILLDHPFTGKLKIEPDGYKIILMMEKERLGH